MAVGVKMRKGNRVIHVEEGRVNSFLAQGYDQINEDGRVVKRATGGRTVNIAEYNMVVEKLEALKEENATLKAKIAKLEKGAKK